MITINNIHKRFGDLQVLEGINMSSLKNGIFAILGPNGSGKTTLIKCILGMVIPENGTIQINNENIIGKWQYRQNISYMSQISNFPPNITINELIKLIKTMRLNKTKEKEIIEMFDLNTSLDKKFSTLSGGTKQKVNIMLTFMSDSPIIILDEPTTGLDPLALIKFKQLLLKEKGKGKIIIITSHIINLIEEIADNIVFILEGKVFFNGTITKLKETTKMQSLEYAIAKIIKRENV